MRRIIHNTTAIAACLSLLVPQLAQSRDLVLDAGAPAKGGQAEDAALVLAQAEGEVPPPLTPGAEAEGEQRAPAAEEPAEEPSGADQPASEAEPAPVEEPADEAEPSAEQQPPATQAPAAQDEPAAEAAPEAAPEPDAADEAPAADDGQSAAPAEAGGQADAAADDAPAPDATPQGADQKREQVPSDDTDAAKADRAEQRADRQAEQEEATREGLAERPEEAAREQQAERPEEAAREQQAERPEPRGTDTDAQSPGGATEPAEAGTPEAGQADAQGDDTKKAAPDQAEADKPGSGQASTGEANGDALTPPTAATPPAEAAEGEPAAATDEQALRDALAREEKTQQGEPSGSGSDSMPATAGTGTLPEASAPATQGSREAAQETGGATAAALDESTKGEVVEQKITEENSRSSSEDFKTDLADAQQAPATGQARQDDDDDNDLAKALLLGLGAVAVGAYLNNNRQVALSAPDRIVVTRPDGSQELIKDEVALLRQPGSTVTTENFDDGSSRTVVTRADGSKVVTIRDADLRVLRRTLVSADGTQTRLIDDTAQVEPVDIATLPAPAPVARPGSYGDEVALRAALRQEADVDRRFTLGQIRNIPEVRALVAPVTIDAITFDTGSAAISPDQARQLSALGRVIREVIAENPREVFLIEGHTDTVGSDAANLALSDRRAESVALALSEYFDVPPENMVVQGYGEQFPQVRQEGDVRENRRAAVRRITDLLQTADAR